MGGTAVGMQAQGGGGGGHPLFFHSIILYVLAATIVTLGIVGIVQTAMAAKEEPEEAAPAAPAKGSSSGGVIGGLDSAATTQREVQAAKMTAGRLTQPPRDLASVAAAAKDAKAMADKSKAAAAAAAKAVAAYVVPILTIVIGLLCAGAATFVLLKKNWARYVAFGIVTLCLCYYTWGQAAMNGIPEVDFAVWRPLVLTVIAALAAKFIWDLYQEKFEAA